MADASSLKRELVEGLDILIVRELTGGVYFGEPKTITDLGNGQKRAIDTQVYETYEIDRIVRVAMDLARTRKNKVHSADKKNVMKSGVLWDEVAQAVAKDYPDVAFLMGSSFKPDAAAAPNFSTFDNFIQDASYLSGLIAGAMTKSKNIGMVGGYPIPEVNRLMNAFMAGVKETAPDTKFQVAFIGSWFDPPKAKETAFAQIDAGADLLYAERFGVSDAAKERKVLAVGNVIDTQGDYPETVVASALWHFEPTLDHAIEQVKAGTFKAEDYGVYSFMKSGGCSLAPLGAFEGKVPADVVSKVAEKEKAIKDGSFTVEINDAEPKSS
ncbi:MAG: BMP family ABC transporter substrate-binding protein [Mesorhizobium sp.]|nr:BMP family ABC transporter substrate-binding protein [Mesorhizobium sp.]